MAREKIQQLQQEKALLNKELKKKVEHSESDKVSSLTIDIAMGDHMSLAWYVAGPLLVEFCFLHVLCVI